MATYSDSAALAADPDFALRVGACAASEAERHDPLAELDTVCLRSPQTGAVYFMPLIQSDPSIVDFYSDPNGPGQANVPDQAILSVVQGNWSKVAEIWGLA